MPKLIKVHRTPSDTVRSPARKGPIASLLLVAALIGAGSAAALVQAPATTRVAIPLDDEARQIDAVEAAGGEIVAVEPDLGTLFADVPDADRLRRRIDAPVHVDPGARLAGTPDDPRWDDQWGPEMLDMPQAWSITGGDRKINVAVVDSGVDTTHEDLDDVPVVDWRDYVIPHPDPRDPHGHGTHVAGIVLAERDNGAGIAGMADVSLMAYRVLDSDGGGSCTDIALAIDRAVDRGADVINLSVHCNLPFPPIAAAVSDAAARGSVVVAAAGNEGTDLTKCPRTPARYPTVVAVAAIRQDRTRAPFSCIGAEVELSAPGAKILSTLPGDGYDNYWGTSQATPHVTGTAALMLSLDPDLRPEQVRSILASTADDLGTPGPDPETGYGLVDPVEALTTVQDAPVI